jgi:FRG domain
MTPPGYDIEQFAESEGFLAALARWDARWQPHTSDWIFRGQGDARWDLTPAAHRASCRYPYATNRTYAPLTGVSQTVQIANEAELIRAFAREIDRQGLPLPTEASFRWTSYNAVVGSILGHTNLLDWPSPDIAPLFALAQHHGIPTRLLDWTARPFVAAYFAAVDAATHAAAGEPSSDRHLAVWAISYARCSAILMGDLKGTQQPHLRTVRPPRASNPNLRAQEGIFTLLVKTVGLPTEAYIPPALDSIMSIRLQESAQAGQTIVAPAIRRLDLPWSQAGKLLRLLADEFVSGTQMYPGLAGAVQAIRERALWDQLIAVAGD